MSSIPRILPPSPASDAFLLALTVMSIPRIQTEALAVFPGMGEDERVSYAISEWTSKPYKHFLVCGLNFEERTARHFTIETLLAPPFNLPSKRFAGALMIIFRSPSSLMNW